MLNAESDEGVNYIISTLLTKLTNIPQDPTALTTAQMLREIRNLDKILTTRLDSMDKAVVLFKDDLTRVPTELDKRAAQLKEIFTIRFDGIIHQLCERDVKFNLEIEKIYETFKLINNTINLTTENLQNQILDRDVRHVQYSDATKIALEAALQAQKDATREQNKSLMQSIDKSEQATQKQLEQQRIVLLSVERTLSDKIGDIADRLTRFEGQGAGKTEISAPLWGVIGSVLTGILVASIIIFMNKPIDNTANINRLSTKLDYLERSVESPNIKPN